MTAMSRSFRFLKPTLLEIKFMSCPSQHIFRTFPTLVHRGSLSKIPLLGFSMKLNKTSSLGLVFLQKHLTPTFSNTAIVNEQLVHPPDTSNESTKKKAQEAEFRKAMKYTFLAFSSVIIGTFILGIWSWGSPAVDDAGNPIEDEYSHMLLMKAYILRTYKAMLSYNKMIKDPSREKLLPDPLTEPYYQPPYTLVLEMTGVLVHPDWTYKTGWRFKKRPGVEYFLQQVGPPVFEVVVFTSEQGFTAFPILDTLDPHGYVMYRLFRDSTRYMDGHHVKDLSCLNRDLSKVIYVDWDTKSFSLQPSNALMIKKWTGNDDDINLIDLANMLRTIATSEVDDVRTVLEYYSQFDDPVAVFRENQRRVQEEEEKRVKDSQGKSYSIVGALANTFRGIR